MRITTEAPPRPALASEVERRARRVGAPLATIELLATDPKLGREFLRADREGRAQRFLDALDVRSLERALLDRDARAASTRLACLVLF